MDRDCIVTEAAPVHQPVPPVKAGGPCLLSTETGESAGDTAPACTSSRLPSLDRPAGHGDRPHGPTRLKEDSDAAPGSPCCTTRGTLKFPTSCLPGDSQTH